MAEDSRSRRRSAVGSIQSERKSRDRWKVQACVFDAYGTLFDVHSAVAAYAETVGSDAAREYPWVRDMVEVPELTAFSTIIASPMKA